MEDTLYAYPQGNTMSGGNSGGMTLRDWFAGQALPIAVELAARDPRLAGLGDEAAASFAAQISYSAADAMLATREAK